MKMNLIITGQVRNEATFEHLVRLVADRRDRFKSVVFASWSDQVTLAKGICARTGASDPFEFADCGNAFFGPTISNRDIASFLAQHQQISRALHAVDAAHHLVRLRADFDPVSAEAFDAFIELVENIWANPLARDSSLVFGVDDTTPYFFEDRILLLAPKHVEKIKETGLSPLYEQDYFNLFPEALLYCSFIGGDRDFILHDHRYSRRSGKGDAFSAYDYMSFGFEFSQFAQRYLSRVAETVLFVHDGAMLSGRDDLWQKLLGANFVPTNFRIRDMREYRRTWASRIEAYEINLPYAELRDWTPARRVSVRDEKVLFNSVFVMYFAGNTEGVIAIPVAGGLFDQAIRDLKGSSMMVRGQVDEGREVLNTLLDEGFMGFEQGFYLCRQLAIDRNEHRYAIAKAAFLARFHDLPRAAGHIEEMDAVLASPLVPAAKPRARKRAETAT